MEKQKPVPDYILDWIENFEFQELDLNQQLEVLRFITEDEFRVMHYTSCLLTSENTEGYFPKAGNLKFEFDHPYRLFSLARRKIPVFKVAAILFVCVLFSFMAGYFFHPGHNDEGNTGNRKNEYRSPSSSGNSYVAGIGPAGSCSLHEDSLAAIFIRGIYK